MPSKLASGILRRSCSTILGSSAILVAATGVAVAQTPATRPELTLDEIVVSAQRRDQSLQDVPIAITALASDDLQARQIVETISLLDQVPNAITQNNTGPGAANAYFIRGLGSAQSLATFDSPVGTYVDDLYLGRQAANNFALFDVERVEVLRGPQGTLFGRNTSGGAVRVILRKPEPELDGYVEAGFGRFDRMHFNGVVNVPLSERVFARLAAYYIVDDGYVTNRTTGEDGINDEENKGMRLALRWLATDAVTWDVAADYIDHDHAAELNFDDGGKRFMLTGIPRSGGTLVSPSTGAPLLVGPKNDRPMGSAVETQSIQSNLSVAFDGSRLEFITAYLSTDQDLFIDVFNGGAGAPGSAIPAFQTSLPPSNRGSFGFSTGGLAFMQYGSSDQLTQEIKLDGTLMSGALDYVAGVYYFDEQNTTDIAQVFSVAALGGFPSVLADFIFDNDTEAWAVYGQFDYRATERLTVTLGGRYTDEEKTLAMRDLQPAGTVADHTTANLQALGIPTKLTSSMFTPRVALAYQSSEDTLWFASATRGFKSGGWNASATAAQQVLPFDDEKVWSYEVGAKSTLLDGRLRFNATAFISDIEDAQVLSGQVAPSGAVSFVTRNFADMSVKGLELEANGIVTDNLQAYLALGYQDAEYEINRNAPEFDEFGVKSVAAQQRDCLAGVPGNCNGGIVTASGDIAVPTRTPEVSGTLGFNYSRPVAALRGSFLANAQGRYFKDHPRATANPDFSFTGDQFLYDASIGYLSESEAVRVAIGCRNCGDEAYIVSTVGPYGWINEPRSWGVTARYSFGRR
jgi:iron complex outermembrane recepter protein